MREAVATMREKTPISERQVSARDWLRQLANAY